MSEEHTTHVDEVTLHAYLDDALEAHVRARVEVHLARCAVCAEQVEWWRAFFATVEALPDEPLKRDLASDVLAALQPDSTPLQLWGLLALQVVTALVLLLVARPWVASLFATVRVADVTVWALAEAMGDALEAQMGTILAAADTAGRLSAPLTRVLPVPTLPPLAWGLLLAGALVFWLVANGLLLYCSKNETQRRTA